MDNAKPVILRIIAMITACVIVFMIQPQKFIFETIASDDFLKIFNDYTPYYPGQKEIYKHEVFSPLYAHTKKIVILGASAADAIGCDYSWSKADPTRTPPSNAHFICSIAGQINVLLEKRGIMDWRAFNLARNGSALTSMIFTYARIAQLKPEIVIFGDVVPYYLKENAGAKNLDSDMYAYMDQVFASEPQTGKVWQAYRHHLATHSELSDWQAQPPEAHIDYSKQNYPTNKKITYHDVIVRFISIISTMSYFDAPSLPVKFHFKYRDWNSSAQGEFDNSDPSFGYFQGIKIFQQMQTKDNNKFLFYFSPQYDYKETASRNEALKSTVYGKYLQDNNIDYISLIDLDLKPIYETYDGTHQTIFGNRKIAAKLLEDLEKRKFFP